MKYYVTGSGGRRSVVLTENVGENDSRGDRNEAETDRYIIEVRFIGKLRLGLCCDWFFICCPFKCMQLSLIPLLDKLRDLLSVTDRASVADEGG